MNKKLKITQPCPKKLLFNANASFFIDFAPHLLNLWGSEWDFPVEIERKSN